MPKTTVTLEDVESKDVQARGEAATVYTFKCSDGIGYTTFKRNVAVPGATLRGKVVEIDYSTAPWQKDEKSGTNYYLNSIEAAVGDPGPAVDLAFDTSSSAATTTTSKDVSIARAVALKAAVETATGLQLVDADSSTILTIADAYVEWLLNGTAQTAVETADENFPF